jgi:hypothetical protein
LSSHLIDILFLPLMSLNSEHEDFVVISETGESHSNQVAPFKAENNGSIASVGEFTWIRVAYRDGRPKHRNGPNDPLPDSRHSDEWLKQSWSASDDGSYPTGYCWKYCAMFFVVRNLKQFNQTVNKSRFAQLKQSNAVCREI